MMVKRMMQNRTAIASMGAVVVLCLIVYLSLSSELTDEDVRPDHQLNPSQSEAGGSVLLLNHQEEKIRNSIRAIIGDRDSKLGSDESGDNSVLFPRLVANNRDDGQDGLMDSSVIIYNRVPKTGSTSFMGLTYDLCATRNFHVLHVNTSKNSHIMSLDDQRRFAFNVTNWSSMHPAIFHGHVAFVDFAKFGLKKPIYINLIRDPIQRLVSHYYFLRYGDDFRPHVIRKKMGNRVTFDECVQRQGRDCDPANMWMQIPFFCGQSSDCWVPGSEWALEQAKRNLVNEYMLVGVTEQMRDFVSLLEEVMPRFFSGIRQAYDMSGKSHLRKTYKKIQPSTETILVLKRSRIWKQEQEFYDFALNQFRFLYRQTFGLEDDSNDEAKGQQFFYEKIRPKE